MAESFVGTPALSGEASPSYLGPERACTPSGDPFTELPDMDPHDGPDYVDDWMEKNLPPSLVEFVRTHCTSFARWDLLRRLLADPLGGTLESLSANTGGSQAAIAAELQSLEMAGLVARRRGHGTTTYYLRQASTLARTLEAAVTAYDQDREFRFALVYSIVRASCTGAVQE